MPDVRRKLEQWLETEAAFGVTDVPISPGRSPNVPAATPPARADAVHRQAPAETSAYRTPVIVPAASSPARARKSAPALPPTPQGAIADLPPLPREEKLSQLAALQEHAAQELAPYLSQISTRLVFGEGDADAPIIFIGEGPGIEEDRTGRPFVGRSGQLLDKQIQAMGYQRASVYIANIVKLRSADFDQAEGRVKDRPPTPEEVARQIHILHEQIAIIRPQAIITLGAPAIKWLTGTTEGVMKIRGTWLDHRGIPVMPTYHPAFLLRAYTPENRKKVWEDLQKVMKLVGKK